MKSKNKKSIFSENMLEGLFTTGRRDDTNIFNEIEILSAKVSESEQNAALLRNEKLESTYEARTMADLVKMSCNLPEVDSPERMLSDSPKSEAVHTERQDDNSPYRMVNLISENFRLPNIEEENMLR